MKKDEEEAKEMWKRKREHEEQWEGTREQRVCFHLSQIKFISLSLSLYIFHVNLQGFRLLADVLFEPLFSKHAFK